MNWEMAVAKAQASKRDSKSNERKVYKVVFTDNTKATSAARMFASSINNRIFATNGKATYNDIINLPTAAISRTIPHDRVVSEAISKGLVTVARLA